MALATSMKKGRDYVRLREYGLPIPDFAVFDERCLSNASESAELSAIVERILTEGSGLIGLRTEPKEDPSPLGNYPHVMPLNSEDEVRHAIHKIIDRYPEQTWWFLVNEAFVEYAWNAVVMMPSDGAAVERLGLIGDVNDQDNLPLREAMANVSNCKAIGNWKHRDVRWLRSTIKRSALFDEWLEVSSVYARGGSRKVFWGMR